MSEVTLNTLECALDEAQALRMQVDALQAENAALRTQLADVTESMGRVEERCAKLRELVRESRACIELLCKVVVNDPGCAACPANTKDDGCDSATLYWRAYDLGVNE